MGNAPSRQPKNENFSFLENARSIGTAGKYFYSNYTLLKQTLNNYLPKVPKFSIRKKLSQKIKQLNLYSTEYYKIFFYFCCHRIASSESKLGLKIPSLQMTIRSVKPFHMKAFHGEGPIAIDIPIKIREI